MNRSKLKKEVTKIRKEFDLEETLMLLHELTWIIMMKNEKFDKSYVTKECKNCNERTVHICLKCGWGENDGRE